MAAGQPLPVPGSLGELVRDRLAALPPDARQALLAAAALSEPRLGVIEAALGRDPRPALAQASEATVVAVEGDRVRFVHPLLASGAYGLAGDDDRRVVHRRLAEAVGEPEERARHLALAADGPDEEVAAELEAAAMGARTRGAVAAAAELAEQAAALTPAQDEASRFRRAFLTAQFRFQTGDADGARRLFEELARTSPPGASRAQALTELGRVVMYQGERRRALALVREVLVDADDLESRLAADDRLALILVMLREDLPTAREHALRALEEARGTGDPVALARALGSVGTVGGVTGDPDAVRQLEQAVALEPEHGGFFVATGRPSFNLAAVLMWRDELAPARDLFTVLYRETADEGDEASLAWTADNLANVEFLAGDWDAALRWANEGDELAAQTGQPGQQAYAKATIALVHACRGEVDATRRAAADALELSGDEVAIGWMNARWALGLLALSLGNAAAAHEALDLACAHAEREGVGEPGTMRFVFDDVEALASLGRIEEAEQRLAFVEDHAVRLDRACALATAARCRGLLAAAAGDREAALEAFARALAQHERAPNAFERARTLLALGTTQRAAKQKRAARETLTEAVASFERLGARLWVARAREELGRISGRAPSRDELTPTERRVAELVAGGMTNQDVAAALFVSPRTVEFHLRNVFRKLGVHARGELARRLSSLVA
jgi:DNA-binding CsgD family transcriptional regulator